MKVTPDIGPGAPPKIGGQANFHPISEITPSRTALSVAIALSVAGCVGLSPDAGFKDVQALSAARLDQRAQWNTAVRKTVGLQPNSEEL